MASIEQNCTLLLQPLRLHNDETRLTLDEIKTKLEGKDEEKIVAMKQLIVGMLNGEQMETVLMHVIRFTITSNNHRLKKLLMIYWECVDKRGADGKILPEMILVCNALRNDLIHPNEYIRGCTLRLCTKLRESEILQPLIPSIVQNLEHRHSYVRRNAVLAVFSIYRSFPNLIPTAPDLVFEMLKAESDITTKRNGFLMLFNCAQEKASEYMTAALDQVTSAGDGFQLVVLELARKLCKTHPQDRSKYIKCIITLMETASDTVLFECASTLVSVSNAPTAVRAAASCYAQLLRTNGDNNVKLVILDRLDELRKNHTKVLQEIVVDLLPAIQSSSPTVQSKAVPLITSLVTERTVEEVVKALKRELTKKDSIPESQQSKKVAIQALHQLARRFPHVSSSVVTSLLEFLPEVSQPTKTAPSTDKPTTTTTTTQQTQQTTTTTNNNNNNNKATDSDDEDNSRATNGGESGEKLVPVAAVEIGGEVVRCVRELVAKNLNLRAAVIEKLISMLDSLHCARVLRAVLWMCGQWCHSCAEIDQCLEAIVDCVGTLKSSEKQSNAQEQPTSTTTTTVLSDGTYKTLTAITQSTPASTDSGLRTLLLSGDWFLASVLGHTLLKLSFRHNTQTPSAVSHTATTNRCILLIVQLLRFGHSNPAKQIDRDSHDRLTLCLRTLTTPLSPSPSPLTEALLTTPSSILTHMLTLEAQIQNKISQNENENNDNNNNNDDNEGEGESGGGGGVVNMEMVGVDDGLVFRQLRAANTMLSSIDIEDEEFRGVQGETLTSDDFESKLNRTFALTGFGDPLYVEAVMSIHQYDVTLDILVVNRTNKAMKEVSLDLSTSGNLSLCDRPSPFDLPPLHSHSSHTSIKVTSTDTSLVVGNISFQQQQGESGGGEVVTVVVELNNVQIDVLDYVKPAVCSELEFRAMWGQFEWENKIIVNTNLTDIKSYLDRVSAASKTVCLSKQHLSEDLHFASVNFYAKTTFGEDLLMNVSLHKQDSKLSGTVCVRSQSKGVALGVGEKVAQTQRVSS